MLEFIWHLRGAVALDRISSNDAALDRLERLLDKQQKSTVERGADYIAFDDPLWRNALGPNWLAMVIYDRGQFWIEEGLGGKTLRYDLRSLHGLVFCLCAAFIAFFFGLAGDDLSGGLNFAVGAFVWLYGMNIVLAVARVPPAIRKAIRSP
jgi:hypothetical protein